MSRLRRSHHHPSHSSTAAATAGGAAAVRKQSRSLPHRPRRPLPSPPTALPPAPVVTSSQQQQQQQPQQQPQQQQEEAAAKKKSKPKNPWVVPTADSTTDSTPATTTDPTSVAEPKSQSALGESDTATLSGPVADADAGETDALLSQRKKKKSKAKNPWLHSAPASPAGQSVSCQPRQRTPLLCWLCRRTRWRTAL